MRMVCPHCVANLLRDGEDLFCLACGYRETPKLSDPPADLSYWLDKKESLEITERREEILRLTYDYTPQEIAERLDIKIATVYHWRRHLGLSQQRAGKLGKRGKGADF